jgi:hypothetical protein
VPYSDEIALIVDDTHHIALTNTFVGMLDGS